MISDITVKWKYFCKIFLLITLVLITCAMVAYGLSSAVLFYLEDSEAFETNGESVTSK